MIVAFIAFWVLLFLGREELGFKGIILAIAVWAGLLAGTLWGGVPLLFASAQAIIDIGLVLVVFGGDIKIR
jgi:hypothetical protein